MAGRPPGEDRSAVSRPRTPRIHDRWWTERAGLVRCRLPEPHLRGALVGEKEEAAGSRAAFHLITIALSSAFFRPPWPVGLKRTFIVLAHAEYSSCTRHRVHRGSGRITPRGSRCH